MTITTPSIAEGAIVPYVAPSMLVFPDNQPETHESQKEGMATRVRPDPTGLPSDIAGVFERLGFGVELGFNPTCETEIFVAITATAPPTLVNWQKAITEAMSFGLGLQWSIGDLLCVGQDFYEDSYTQHIPHTGKAVKTLLNWQSVARSFPTLGKNELVDTYWEMVQRGEYYYDGQHIGFMRLPCVDWSLHQRLQAWRNGALVPARARLLLKAAREKWTVSDLEAAKAEDLAALAAKGDTYAKQLLEEKGEGYDIEVERLELFLPTDAAPEELYIRLQKIVDDVIALRGVTDRVKLIGRLTYAK